MTNLLNLSEVAERTRLSRSTVYRLINEGRFPKPRRLSARRVMWAEADIEVWLADLGAEDE